jgi:YihY family inner membrane protein
VKKKLDAFQQRHPVAGFLFAIQKKYGDDQGGQMAALVTYYGFLSVFPLLLAAFTIVAYALAGDTSAIHTLESHLGNEPILGQAARDLEGKHLHGSPLAVVVAVIGLVWGAMGLAQITQQAMNDAWNVPWRDRMGFGPRLLRGLGWYVLFGLGILASTFVTSIGAWLGWAGGPWLSALMALILNAVIFVASFWILSPPAATRRQHLPGAIFGAVAWTVLTGIGTGLAHKLAHSNPLYGSFASVLGLLALLYLAARLTLYGIEANVVIAKRLWPRSLTNDPLSAADKDQLVNLARREERVSAELVHVDI